MSTRKHVHEEIFPVPPEALFSLLYTPSAIRGWWGAAHVIVIPTEGGIWAASWGADEDAPDYISAATLMVLDPPKRMVFGNYKYYSKAGPLPFQAEFTTEFIVESAPGGSRLRVIQDGFPVDSIADDFYAACETGWHETFRGIRRFLEEVSDE